MKNIPPFAKFEHLVSIKGEEVVVLGFDEITDEEIASWYFDELNYREPNISFAKHMKSARELFPSGWSMVVRPCESPYVKRANPWEYYRAEVDDSLPCVLY